MAYLAILGFIGAGVLLYSARFGTSPAELFRAILRGEELPGAKYKIETTPLASPTDSDVEWEPQTGGGTFTGTFARPLSSWRVTSGYGMRWGRMHEGVDVPAPEGTPIRAAAAGTVLRAGYDATGAGNRVVIEHNATYTTKYFHMSRIAASSGQRVAQGQVIGYVGSTGRSSGPHLHFEVWKNGRSQNPAGYVR